MGFSRIKEAFNRRAIRCVILMDSGQVQLKTLKYDKNNFVIWKEKGYVYDPQAAYYSKNKTYSFYYENDPCPVIFKGSSPEIRASDVKALVSSKVIQEVIEGGSMNLVLLLLVIVNLLVSLVIIAKLWGAFDK